MRRAAPAIAGVLAALVLATPSIAAFAAPVLGSGSAFSAYVVPAPTNVRCSGLGALGTSRIEWNAVAPPPGDSIAYVVTAPGGGTTTTSATSHQLPVVALPGQYAVRARIASGWLSQSATIAVSLTAFGLLYLCSAP